jgi:hypothetical protein
VRADERRRKPDCEDHERRIHSRIHSVTIAA